MLFWAGLGLSLAAGGVYLVSVRARARVLNLNPRWKVRETARLVCVEAFPDLAALSDADLKALTEEKMADERDVSRRRRELHGRIDLLRTEHTRRLKERHG